MGSDQTKLKKEEASDIRSAYGCLFQYFFFFTLPLFFVVSTFVGFMRTQFLCSTTREV